MNIGINSRSKDEALVQKLYIESPCDVPWDSMEGDERTRFCGQCKLNVYNVAEMSTKEAAELVRKSEGRMCLKLYRRKDGTIITDNCPVGLKKTRDRIKRCAVAVLTTVAWVGFISSAQAQGWFGYSESETKYGGCPVMEMDSSWPPLVSSATALNSSTWLSLNVLFLLMFFQKAKIATIGTMLLSVWAITGVIYCVYCGSDMSVAPETAQRCNDLCLFFGGGTLLALCFVHSLIRGKKA